MEAAKSINTQNAQSNDPRDMTIPVLRRRNLSLVDQPLPCGADVCDPFSAVCQFPVQESLWGSEATRRLCATTMANMVLAAEVERLEDVVNRRNDLIDRLSIDAKTGIFTYSTLLESTKMLFESGRIEAMRQAGFLTQISVTDLNYLSIHNLLGTHAAGDIAINAVVGGLKSQYRRGGDHIALPVKPSLPGVMAYDSQAAEAIKQNTEQSLLSRFSAGDEIVGVSWTPTGERRSNKPESAFAMAQRRVVNLVKALEDVYVEYPYTSDQSPEAMREEIRHITGDGPEFEFTIEKGTVRAKVTACLALGVGPMPQDMAEFSTYFEEVDQVLMKLKKRSGHVKTLGAAQSLFVMS